MNLKKTLKYFSLAAVSVLAIGALVACSSSSEKKKEKIRRNALRRRDKPYYKMIKKTYEYI